MTQVLYIHKSLSQIAQAHVSTFTWIDGFDHKTYTLNVIVPSCKELVLRNTSIEIELIAPVPQHSVMLMGQYASKCDVKHCDCSDPLRVISDDAKKAS